LHRFLKTTMVARDNCILRQSAFGGVHVNALKRKNFL
jgi:hypothetical protein